MGLLCVLFVGLCGLVKDSVEKWINTKPVEVSAGTANSFILPSEAKSSSHLESDKAQEASQVTNQLTLHQSRRQALVLYHLERKAQANSL